MTIYSSSENSVYGILNIHEIDIGDNLNDEQNR